MISSLTLSSASRFAWRTACTTTSVPLVPVMRTSPEKFLSFSCPLAPIGTVRSIVSFPLPGAGGHGRQGQEERGGHESHSAGLDGMTHAAFIAP